MNDLFARFDLLWLKSYAGAMLLPPVPLLLLALLGALLLRRRRKTGWALLLGGLAGVWALCTVALGTELIDSLTKPPPALEPAQRAALVAAPRTVILVLGAGRRHLAPEYGSADLKPLTLERLRYGLWLARQTRLPVAYSGGLGHGSPPGPTEAEVAARVARRDFGQPLRWLEDRSRDTDENARFSVALLRAEGIRHIVLVTHGFHQRRALAAFERALQSPDAAITVLAAPVGLRPPGDAEFGDWWPTPEGFSLSRLALHEWLGRIAGA